MKGLMGMELTYTKQGDYLIPDLTLPEEEAIVAFLKTLTDAKFPQVK